MDLLNEGTAPTSIAQLSKTACRWAIASLAAVISFVIDYFWSLVSSSLSCLCNYDSRIPVN
jgi:hypothetical protein